MFGFFQGKNKKECFTNSMTASQIWWKDQSAEFYEVIPKHSPSPRTVWCLTTNSTSIAERVAPYVCLIPPCWLSPANVNELGRWDEASDIIPKQYLTCFTPGLNKRQTLDNSYSSSKCPFYLFVFNPVLWHRDHDWGHLLHLVQKDICWEMFKMMVMAMMEKFPKQVSGNWRCF